MQSAQITLTKFSIYGTNDQILTSYDLANTAELQMPLMHLNWLVQLLTGSQSLILPNDIQRLQIELNKAEVTHEVTLTTGVSRVVVSPPWEDESTLSAFHEHFARLAIFDMHKLVDASMKQQILANINTKVDTSIADNRLAEILDAEQSTKLLEVETKLSKVQAELNAQRQADEAAQKVVEVRKRQQEQLETKQDLDMLLSRRDQLVQKIQTHKVQNLTPAEVESLRQELRNLRESQIESQRQQELDIQYAGNGGAFVGPKYLHPELLSLPLFLILIAAVIGLVTRDYLVVIPTLVGVIALGYLYYLFVHAPVLPKILIDKILNPVTHRISKIMDNNNGKIGQRLQQLQHSLVEIAWQHVLGEELQKLDKFIQTFTKGEPVAQILARQQQIAAELDQLEKIIADQKEHELDPDAYLAKRREVDQLRVEKSKILTNVEESKREEVEKVLAGRQVIANSQNKTQIVTLPPDLTQQPGKIFVSDTGLFSDETGRVVELAAAAAQFCWLYLWMQAGIDKGVHNPYLILTPLQFKLPALANLDAKISELKNFTQVLVIHAS